MKCIAVVSPVMERHVAKACLGRSFLETGNEEHSAGSFRSCVRLMTRRSACRQNARNAWRRGMRSEDGRDDVSSGQKDHPFIREEQRGAWKVSGNRRTCNLHGVSGDCECNMCRNSGRILQCVPRQSDVLPTPGCALSRQDRLVEREEKFSSLHGRRKADRSHLRCHPPVTGGKKATSRALPRGVSRSACSWFTATRNTCSSASASA